MLKNQKKLIALVLMLVLVLGIFAGCSGKQTAADNTTTPSTDSSANTSTDAAPRTAARP